MGKRIPQAVWDTVEIAILLCIAEDEEVTSHNVAAYAEEYGATEVTQARAYHMLNDWYEAGKLTRRESHGPTEYVFAWAKDPDEGCLDRETNSRK